jgi:hypothetical protein
MTRLKRATIALPLMVVLLGVVVPVLMEKDDETVAADAKAPEPRVSGRTASEWAALADGALDRGRFNEALSHIKTAESVAPGVQYADELSGIRRAKWRAAEVRRLTSRLLAGDIDHADFRSDGSVASAHRLVTVLPGESQWTLARDMAAARRGVTAAEIDSRDRDVYALWDTLTAINGVRELDVGERVRVPVPAVELAALADANRRDLERVADASTALAAGDLEEASRLRDALEGAFAETTAACRGLDSALASALEERTARMELEREQALVEDARTALARVPELPRATRHRERLHVLIGAQAALSEAEAVREGAQYPDAAELVSRLLGEERKFRVARDGSLLVGKPSGVRYTEAVHRAVEWMLERELSWSGSRFPHSNRKTRDEIAWASYLAAAAKAAERRGVDFGALLDAGDEERELMLPDPVAYFAN